MAENPFFNRVDERNGSVIMDISDTTATANDVLAGKKFYSASGAPATGTLVPGTITEVQANGTSVATSGVANIPAASTAEYGVTKLNNTTSSTSTSEAATAAVVKQLNDDLNNAAKKQTYHWNIDTTDGAEYTTVCDIDLRSSTSSLVRVLFASALYISGRPAGIRIGIKTNYESEAVSWLKTFEEADTELQNGCFVIFYNNVQRVIVQEKLASSSGRLNGNVMIIT